VEESFCLLGESADVRIGAQSIEDRPGIEVLVRVHSPFRELDLVMMRRSLNLLEKLEGREYHLFAQDGWWVVAEQTVCSGELGVEERFALATFAELLGGQ
jgi:hypothetical protein